MKQHLVIPEQFRKLYKRAASHVYSDVAADVPGIEDDHYSKRAVIEIVRDANRIRIMVEHSGKGYGSGYGYSEEFKKWIKEHEYDEAYRRDMNKAIQEALYGD